MVSASGYTPIRGEDAESGPAAVYTVDGAEGGGYQTAGGDLKAAVVSAWRGPGREVNLYTAPLMPDGGLGLRERVTLVVESCRPWGVFADMKSFNLPVPSEVKVRYGHNVETFFYNYVVLALVYSLLFVFTRPVSVMALVGVVALAVYLHVLHPEPLHTGDYGFSIDATGKYIIDAVAAFLALFVFGGFMVLYSVAIFAALTVLLHGFFRDHTA